jgi:hypothetical protein
MLSRVDNALPVIIKHVCQTRIDREPRSRRGPVKPVSLDRKCADNALPIIIL